MAVIETPSEYAYESRHLATQLPDIGKPRVVIIGGGFAGIQIIKNLRMKDVQVVMLDRHNYHTFQPLLYQVATAGLEPDSIAGPLRKVFDEEKNFFFRMATVESVSPEESMVNTNIGRIHYDYLVIATGTKTNYFGNKSIEELAFPLKQVPQALNLRSHFLQNFERAVTSDNEDEIDRLTNFVIVGGGPTGVELAGALGELKTQVLPRDYPELDFNAKMNIYLVEGLGRLLPAMSEKAGEKAQNDLENRFKVNVKLNTMVEDFDGYQVKLNNGNTINTETLIWAAGVMGVTLPGLDKATVEKSRYIVNQFNLVQGYDNIYAVGDVAKMSTEDYPDGHPQLAPVALQQGENLGKNISKQLKGKDIKPFHYLDKGTMATIGRNRAVADLPGGLKFGGFVAWIIWMFVHLMYLVSFRQKLITLGNWVWNYFTYDKGTRLIIRPFDYRSVITRKKEQLKKESEAKETA
ncbi:NADH dehydrogenase [Catalinimonas alkaloidigena]|uniref:NAD(P)/FAD-dependent oxidoreductase n=1 Tax=Catalinimonas alkaloidigena TaxID=1075417 RepID=UPI00240703F5|nr:NAD(P)/FAD-dependent oxidoreductase [Catalinimonas alkaloidigena]MDF9794760.1 NADH dehydrogenase [Catalinimonas alkaloidigena]